MAICFWRVAATALLISALPAQANSEIERAGKHFRIVFHHGELRSQIAGTLAEQALSTLEDFSPTLQKLLGVRDTEVATIHLYRKRADFRSAAADSPWPFVLEGFVTKGGEGHVLCWPELPESLLLETGVPHSTRETLLRVAAEQQVGPLVADFDVDRWFHWLLVIGAVETATNPEHRPGVDWAHDTRRAGIVWMRHNDSAYTLEDLLEPDLDLRQREDWDRAMTGFAVLAQGLAERSSSWAKKLLKKPKRSRRQSGTVARRRAAVSSIVGDWTKAEARFAKLCSAILPVWETRRPLWVPGRRSLLVGEANDAAAIMTAQQLPDSDYVVAGRMELGRGSDTWLRVALGWDEDDKSMVVLFFEEDFQAISVWDTAANEFDRKATARPPIARDKPFDFRIEVTATDITVRIDGVVATNWQHGGREMREYLGFEVNDRLVWLEDVVIEPLSRKKR